MFNDNNDGERIEELNEIDETGEHKPSKDDEGKKGGLFSFGGGGGGSSRPTSTPSGNGNGSQKILLVVVIGMIASLFFFGSELETMFRASPFENIDSMVHSMQNANEVSKLGTDFNDIYDKNFMYQTRDLLGMPEGKYLIYIYADNDLDRDLNGWVLENDSDIKIYRTNYEIARDEVELTEILDISRLGIEPVIVLVNGTGSGKRFVTTGYDVEDMESIKENYFTPESNLKLEEEDEDSK